MTYSRSESQQADNINLHVIRDVTQLAKIAGHLESVQHHTLHAMETLELTRPYPEVTWQGYPVASWLTDLKTRVGVLELEQKRNKLESLEKRLDAILSPELKRQMELESIMKELG